MSRHLSNRFRIRAALGLSLALAGAVLAPTFGATSSTWDRLAQCESGRRWDANTGNSYYGGLQFSAGTWLAYGGDEFASKAHKATRAQQITVAERLLHDRGWGPWPACSKKLGLKSADALGSPFAPPVMTPPTTTPPSETPPAAVPPATPLTPEQTALAKAEKKVANKSAAATRAHAKALTAQADADKAAAKAKAAKKGERTKTAKKAAAAQAAADKATKDDAKAQKELAKAQSELAAARAAAGPTS